MIFKNNIILIEMIKGVNICMKKKVNKNELLENVATKRNVPMGLVKDVYDGLVDEIISTVSSGYDLSLTGFGTFSLKKHKGHPVQFEAKSDIVGDYVVLKFAPSDVLMTVIRNGYADGKVIVSDNNKKK